MSADYDAKVEAFFKKAEENGYSPLKIRRKIVSEFNDLFNNDLEKWMKTAYPLIRTLDVKVNKKIVRQERI